MLIAFSVANFRSTLLRRQTLGLDANSAGRIPLEGHVRKGVRNRKDEGRDFEGGAGTRSRKVDERASIVRKGAAQSVRLPRELHFPADIREVWFRKRWGGLLISPVTPSWSSFFAIQVDVPNDFLESRDDSLPESRDP
jgi:virulence-associated protein VagC